MDGEIPHLPADRVAEFHRLRSGPLQRNGHIAQGTQASLRIQIIAPVPGQVLRCQPEHGKGENIGRPVHLPAGQIDGVNPVVIGEQHVDLTGNRHLLRLQGGQNALANHAGNRDRQKAPVVKRNVDFGVHFRLPL